MDDKLPAKAAKIMSLENLYIYGTYINVIMSPSSLLRMFIITMVAYVVHTIKNSITSAFQVAYVCADIIIIF